MSYNKIMIGKIRNVDYKKGIGEIIAANGEGFLFTIDDINDVEFAALTASDAAT
jgi:hypothetical protein